MKRSTACALCCAFFVASLHAAGPSDRAIELRNKGIAELENEAPTKAEATFLELAGVAPNDPLPAANLAIATLRQQRFEEAQSWLDKARKIAPNDPRLTAIQAEIYHWSGNSPEALRNFRLAADALPTTVDYQYSLYRQAMSSNDASAANSAQVALSRLAELRPENLVVLLQLGHQARTNDDRAAASSVYLRIRELIWQSPRGGEELLERILSGLEAADLASLRSSALRLENVLKITPMYKEGLRELSNGIQGIPLLELRDEPPFTGWGKAALVSFKARTVAARASGSAAVAIGDLDGDESPEIFRLLAGQTPRIEVLDGGGGNVLFTAAAPAGIERLKLIDIDNDGDLEILGHGATAAAVWGMSEEGVLEDVTGQYLPPGSSGKAAAILDFDIEGDLDLLLAGDNLRLLRNSLEGPFEDVGAKSLPVLDLSDVRDAMASDLDRDGDLDLLLAHGRGLTWLDNLRQGRFADRSSLIATRGPTQKAIAADLDNDGLTDIVALGSGLLFFHNNGDRFTPWAVRHAPVPDQPTALAVFDADNDGYLDIAAAGSGGVTVLARRGDEYVRLPVEGAVHGIRSLATGDLDGDGDVELVAAGPGGMSILDNQGGNRNRYLQVRLRGINKGNSKNNVFGLGATVEVRAGTAYQLREVTGDVVYLGLGQVRTPDLVRVVWTNGVPQNRLQPATNQRIVEEQLLKGSCPFLYVPGDDGFNFVTDLLWGAPAGLPVAEGIYLGADPEELVKIDDFEPRDGAYEIRITEELWEAAFFDRLRLWVVDHPADIEVSSSLRVLPGESLPEEVLASADVRPVATAWDAAGRDVTRRVLARDEIYADGWQRSAWQGVATERWAFVIDLGEAPGSAIRLLLDGWIFPTDASLNLALAQRSGPSAAPPALEMETASGWVPLIPSMGFPAGKTKTMVIDTPALPPDSRRLRIVSGQWLSWDRIAWTDRPADEAARVIAQLDPVDADLHYRGFSKVVRQAPNAPHTFDYQTTKIDSPWLPFPGRYTRFGDVQELLLESDDRSVIMGPGDEMTVLFDASGLAPVEPGMRRTVFLESHGWDKDADRNTGEGLQVGPLPFRAMSGYPYGPDEAFPDTPLHREYIDSWLTRVVETPAPGGAGAAIAP